MATGGDPRYTQKIRAKRIALGYFKLLHPLRRWKLILSIAAPALAGIWLLAHATQGDQRIYNAATVSTAHQMFETDCKVCHGPGPAPGAAAGLAPGTPIGYWARVSDNACKACHAGPAHHDNEQFTPECASCHMEHGGRDRLVQIADQHCAQCHRDLKTRDGSPTEFHKTLPALRDHPEFAVNVHEGAKILRVRLDDKAVRDTAQIKLNHTRHLKVNLKGIEDIQKQLGMTGVVKVKDGVQLGCTFCHRPDDNWQYMRPVSYKEHCAICHELSTGIGDIVAPHETSGLVHAFTRGAAGEAFDQCQAIPKGDAGKALRERCEGLGLAAAAPEPAAEDQPRGRRRSGGDEAPTPAPDAPRGGRLRGGAAAPDHDGGRLRWAALDIVLVQDDAPRGRRLRGGSEEEAAPTPAPGGGGGGGAAASAGWVSQQLGAADKKLFQTKEDGCEKCHMLNRTAGVPVAETVPTAIPKKWLPHARFDHSAHRPLACAECHKAAASSETKDVLLPSMTTCRDCHRGKGGARNGCVECHRYHDKAKERDADGPFNVKQLLTGVGQKRPDRLR